MKREAAGVASRARSRVRMDEATPTTPRNLIIGQNGVGKSSLLLGLTDDTSDPELTATTGVELKVKTI